VKQLNQEPAAVKNLIFFRLDQQDAVLKETNEKLDRLHDAVLQIPKCPAPGRCMELEKSIAAVKETTAANEQEIRRHNELLAWVSGARWSAGAMGGAIAAGLMWAATAAWDYFIKP
jgi:hypothetical protein